MDAKIAYWTAALINMGALSLIALNGWRLARQGSIAAHRKSMRLAAILVLAFVVSYPIKLLFLGREQLENWTTVDQWILRIHELCILIMLIAGGTALRLGSKLSATRLIQTDNPDAPPARPETLRLHRRAGRLAIAATLAAFFLACLVLRGMYERIA